MSLRKSVRSHNTVVNVDLPSANLSFVKKSTRSLVYLQSHKSVVSSYPLTQPTPVYLQPHKSVVGSYPLTQPAPVYLQPHKSVVGSYPHFQPTSIYLEPYKQRIMSLRMSVQSHNTVVNVELPSGNLSLGKNAHAFRLFVSPS
jgi:hypothetical protein